MRPDVLGDRPADRPAPATFRRKDLLLGPPKPRHEVVVLVDGVDRAVLHALQHARQLNPLTIAALHVAADPGAAERLTRLAGVNVAVVHPTGP